jgi:hypothetical protein
VSINPISTNSAGPPVDSAKKFSSFGAGVQQENRSQGPSSGHGSNDVIRANSVCTIILEADHVRSLNPDDDLANTPEPVPGVDLPTTPIWARDEFLVDHLSSSTAARGKDVSHVGHVPLALPGGGSFMLVSSALLAPDSTLGMPGAAATSASAGSPAPNRPKTRL